MLIHWTRVMRHGLTKSSQEDEVRGNLRLARKIYSHIIPPWLDYKILKLRGRILNWSSERAAFEETKFHERTACKAFVGICTLGGFFIKKGQQLLLKKGLMPPQYYDALKPLLADVPERPFLVMAKVFHDSTGKSLSEVFETINPNCIGAASLAQTYVGVLRPEYRAGKEARKVIVKIQYPEVRAYFALDLRIILRLCNSFFPRMYEANKAAQEQHLRELDMWNEAQTLERMGRAMARAGLSPHKVVVPQPARCLTSKLVNDGYRKSKKTLGLDIIEGAVRLERPIQSRLKNEERLARGAMPIFAPAIEHAPQTRGNEPRFNRHSWRRSERQIERLPRITAVLVERLGVALTQLRGHPGSSSQLPPIRPLKASIELWSSIPAMTEMEQRAITEHDWFSNSHKAEVEFYRTFHVICIALSSLVIPIIPIICITLCSFYIEDEGALRSA
ncbi:hypothetical protein AURANDRAFT_68874 [Aureococcus anophagefferens]|uniref:ABC1 atypical kinase-like domain-containing protein n=1 Tax=Aureococcus anophagefferens TaxID=44056 RepID=F0YR15_AURAN|nr:hypothetical protein AURANDRAFT_68874 [Aureococcus anophagefferens]EGB02444.1 hypothetical protein AURANDRAFT_68874 [Aureococcus anophagefferens]|eukprot:XP_009042857.1 hypothetical protein AURANDRAFT_68874 [Aureococcus anophagefferens]